MFDAKTECDIVMDLLPLYAEQKTSRESKELIEAHVSRCPDCRQSLLYMEQSYGQVWAEEHAEPKACEKPINKKLRKKPGKKFGKKPEKKREQKEQVQAERPNRHLGAKLVGGYLLFLLAVWVYIIYLLMG